MQRSEMTFTKGSILRKEMLTDLYEYPRMAIASYYASHTDGILYGMEWCDDQRKKGCHLITPGALKLQGEIYFLSRYIEVEEEIDNLKTDRKYRLFFMKQDVERETPSRTVYPLRLEAIQSDRLEEARSGGFYYAYIECKANGTYLLIEDEKELYGLAAANDGYGYSLPSFAVCHTIKEIVEGKMDKHPLDYQLLQNIYEKKSISVSFVKLYIQESGLNCTEEDTKDPVRLLKQFADAGRRLKSAVYHTVHVQNQTPVSQEEKKIIVHEGGRL